MPFTNYDYFSGIACGLAYYFDPFGYSLLLLPPLASGATAGLYYWKDAREDWNTSFKIAELYSISSLLAVFLPWIFEYDPLSGAVISALLTGVFAQVVISYIKF